MHKLAFTETVVLLLTLMYFLEGCQAELPAIPSATPTPTTSDAFAIASLIYFLLIIITLGIIVIAVLLKLFKETELEE